MKQRERDRNREGETLKCKKIIVFFRGKSYFGGASCVWGGVGRPNKTDKNNRNKEVFWSGEVA